MLFKEFASKCSSTSTINLILCLVLINNSEYQQDQIETTSRYVSHKMMLRNTETLAKTQKIYFSAIYGILPF
jgi:hypothetical protein